MDLHQTGQNEGTRKRDGKLVAFDLRKRKGFGEIRNIVS